MRRPAKIYLLPAREAPLVVVLRLESRRRLQVLKWDTHRDTIEEGSRFTGRVDIDCCDVSFDGAWMVYRARGGSGQEWSGICRPPWLRCVGHADHNYPCIGGGFWATRDILYTGNWSPDAAPLPFSCRNYDEDACLAEELKCGAGFLVSRLRRDGWKRDESRVEHREFLVNDPWLMHHEYTSRPSVAHPCLRIIVNRRGPTRYAFKLDDHDGFLDDQVTWAAWDSKGDLLVARAGSLLRYDPGAIPFGKPAFEIDLE